MVDEEKTTVIQKESQEGTAANNYRPITCLPIMWLILTAKIRKEGIELLNQDKIRMLKEKETYKYLGI